MSIAYNYRRPIGGNEQITKRFFSGELYIDMYPRAGKTAHHNHKRWRERVAYIRICSLIHFSERWLRHLFTHSQSPSDL